MVLNWIHYVLENLSHTRLLKNSLTLMILINLFDEVSHSHCDVARSQKEPLNQNFVTQQVFIFPPSPMLSSYIVWRWEKSHTMNTNTNATTRSSDFFVLYHCKTGSAGDPVRLWHCKSYKATGRSVSGIFQSSPFQFNILHRVPSRVAMPQGLKFSEVLGWIFPRKIKSQTFPFQWLWHWLSHVFNCDGGKHRSVTVTFFASY